VRKEEEYTATKTIYYCDRCEVRLGEYDKTSIQLENWTYDPTPIKLYSCLECVKWVAVQFKYSGKGSEHLRKD